MKLSTLAVLTFSSYTLGLAIPSSAESADSQQLVFSEDNEAVSDDSQVLPLEHSFASLPLTRCGTAKLSFTHGVAPYKITIGSGNENASPIFTSTHVVESNEFSWQVDTPLSRDIILHVVDAEGNVAILYPPIEGGDSSCLVDDEVRLEARGVVKGGSGSGGDAKADYFGGPPGPWKRKEERGVVKGGSSDSGASADYFGGPPGAWKRGIDSDKIGAAKGNYFGGPPGAWRRDEEERGVVKGSGGGAAQPDYFGGPPGPWRRDQQQRGVVKGGSGSGSGSGDAQPDYFGGPPGPWRRDQEERGVVKGSGGGDAKPDYFGGPPGPWRRDEQERGVVKGGSGSGSGDAQPDYFGGPPGPW